MKIIIAGSRAITDGQHVNAAVIASRWLTEITEVVSGGARGVDKMGENYALCHCLSCKVFPAHWKLHGKSAGYKRNVEMAEYADALIAIWDGESKGTYHMINIMKARNKPVYIYLAKNTSTNNQPTKEN